MEIIHKTEETQLEICVDEDNGDLCLFKTEINKDDIKRRDVMRLKEEELCLLSMCFVRNLPANELSCNDWIKMQETLNDILTSIRKR